MNGLFGLSSRLMERLTIPRKLALLGAVVLVAIAACFLPLLQRINADLSFAGKEAQAVPLIVPARELLQAVQTHRGLAQQAIAGNSTQASQMLQAAVRADGLVLQTQGEALGVDADWAKLRNAWANVKAQATRVGAEESFRLHSELIAQIQDYIGLVAYRTNAALDPDFSTYYLMLVFSADVPSGVEKMGQARARASLVATRHEASEADRIALSALGSLIAGHIADMESHVTKIVGVQTDPAQRQRMSEALQRFKVNGLDFRKIVDGIVVGKPLPADSQLVWNTATQAMDAGYALFDASAHSFDRALAERVDRLKQERNRIYVMVAVSCLVLAYLLFGLRRSLLLALARIEQGSRNMAKGNFATPVEVHSRDELGALARALDSMRRQLGEKIEREGLAAEENLRIRIALDKASVNMMLADADGKIVYCNEAVLQTLSIAESDIRRDLPNFRSNAILGSNFDIFHRNPAHQRNLLSGLRTSHVAHIRVGPRHFRLRANPVLDSGGKRLGTVVEWLDRTEEVKSEEALSAILAAAVAGDFAQRLPVEGKEGFFRQIAEAMNHLLDVVQAGLSDVGGVINAIARGDLTVRIDNEYMGVFGQLKDDTNGTVDRLREALGRIHEAAHAVNVAAQEIAAGNSDLSSRTEEQASSLEETASSMEQLNQTVKQNAENAGKANQLAEHSNRVAQDGGARVRQVVATMDIIQSSASKIAEIIGVIDSIAFQTNILALNAAVEAARAGEQGRGFAVVASEVRSLAQRSAQAAKEIKSLIVDSVDKVEGGAKQVREAGVTIEQMVSGLGELAQLVTDIATASKEQANGIEQVTTAVGHMDEVTQQNAALVEEAAAASESLEDQSRALTDAVSMFDLGYAQPTAAKPARQAKAGRAAPRASGGRPAAVAGGEWSEF